MTWKDRWTALMWRISFPGEAIPLDILPSNYARLAKEPKKLSLEDALTQAVVMDMNTYPKQWTIYRPSIYLGNMFYKNEDASVVIELSELIEWSCTINGIEVSQRGNNSNREKIIKAFKTREGAEILERLVDRIEKVITITPEAITKEVSAKTIDPFSPPAMQTLASTINALRENAQYGQQLPSSPSIKPIPPKTILPGVNKPITVPEIATWKGKKMNKLNNREFNEVMRYMAQKGM
jgi:hypothetical protein